MRDHPPAFRRRLDFGAVGAAPLALWHLAAIVTIVALPTLVVLQRPVRAEPAEAQLPLWAWGIAYATLALLLHAWRGRSLLSEAWAVPLQGGVVFAGAYLALQLSAHPVVSRKVALGSALLSVVLVVLPFLLGRWLTAGAVLLLAIGGAAAARPPADAGKAARSRIVVTALQPIEITEYRGLVRTRGAPGGAITAVDAGLVLVTALGDFFRVDFPDSSGAPRVARLPLAIDVGAAALRADSARIFRDAGTLFDVRTNDVIVDTLANPRRVYVTYKHWNAEQRCLTIRVASAVLPAPGAGESKDPWTLHYTSAPCTGMTFDRGHGGFGSRLAWERPGILLLTVGDFGYSGAKGLEGPQDPASPYGKVLRLDLASGTHAIFTLGHRNPQGLAVAPDGTAWSSEHGPQGGDEVNVLEAGANYGWPLATYGTQYGLDNWPLAKNRHDHGDFHEPALAFTPSIGASNLIHVDGTRLPAWGGDILLASLKDRGLYRIRHRGDRVISYERMQIGARIRDLEQLRDGRIVLWTDTGVLVLISRAPVRFGGAMRYAACVGCHGEQLEGTAAGPPLRGIEGRAVASDPAFPYSPALKKLGGTWSADRLSRFLQDPQRVAPGTTMAFEGLDADAIYPLLEYLRTFGAEPIGR